MTLKGTGHFYTIYWGTSAALGYEEFWHTGVLRKCLLNVTVLTDTPPFMNSHELRRVGERNPFLSWKRRMRLCLDQSPWKRAQG